MNPNIAFWNWLAAHFWPVVIILIGTWLARHFGGAVISQLIRRLVRQTPLNELSPDDAKKRQDTLISMFSAIWRVAVLVIGGMILFRELFPSIDFTPIIASAGILGVALGFGAQSLIKDLITGIFIILENQYRVGDVVDLAGAVGTVEQITIRSTVLRDLDGNVHYVPNGTVTHVVNKTMGFSKINITISVAADSDIDKISDVIDKVGIKMAKEEKWKDRIIDPPRFLSIGASTNKSLEVKITGKTQPSKQWSVTDEFRRRLLASLQKHKIEIS